MVNVSLKILENLGKIVNIKYPGISYYPWKTLTNINVKVPKMFVQDDPGQSEVFGMCFMHLGLTALRLTPLEIFF
jgi:hypothetical protein